MGGEVGTVRASCESADEGLWLDGDDEAGAVGKPRSKERSALPRLTLWLLSSFSCVSAANCSKYLYLKVKFQRVSVKRKRSPWLSPVYRDETPAERAGFLMHGAEGRADWRVSLPKAHSEAKMLATKMPASLRSKEGRTSGHITQNRIPVHCCRVSIPLSGHTDTNNNNNNKLANNDPPKALAVTAEN